MGVGGGGGSDKEKENRRVQLEKRGAKATKKRKNDYRKEER